MVYFAPMELQTRIEKLETSLNRQKLINIALASVIVAGVGVAAIQPAGDATFDTITCKAWRVVDKDGEVRIAAGKMDKNCKVLVDAGTDDSNGVESVTWQDKDGKVRMSAGTFPDGGAGVMLLDKNEKLRISAVTLADGGAGVMLLDKNGQGRIMALTNADGTVILPTVDCDLGNLFKPK